MGIQTSDFAISVSNALPAELRKKYMSTSINNYSHVKRVKIKILVDFHEGSNLRSTGFALSDYKDSNLRP